MDDAVNQLNLGDGRDGLAKSLQALTPKGLIDSTRSVLDHPKTCSPETPIGL